MATQNLIIDIANLINLNSSSLAFIFISTKPSKGISQKQKILKQNQTSKIKKSKINTPPLSTHQTNSRTRVWGGGSDGDFFLSLTGDEAHATAVEVDGTVVVGSWVAVLDVADDGAAHFG
ncbi:MAG: hypothetical protein R2769_11715 [Saprospiraceae bacterium]